MTLTMEPKLFDKAGGPNLDFLRDNHNCVAKGVLSGLHCESQQRQANLLREVRVAGLNVAVGSCRNEPLIGRSVGINLTADNFTNREHQKQ